jgi:hypothetical protein
MPRLHSNFPTAQEASDNPDSIYSDNSPILVSIPLSKDEPPVNLISLNALDAHYGNNRSGFNFLFEESLGKQEIRYKKILKGLFLAREIHKADIICLQDANPIMVKILSKYLANNWKIISDIKSGVITVYNASQFDLLKKPTENTQKRRFSIQLKHRKTHSFIEVHNVRCHSTYFPEEKEKEIAPKLRYTSADFSIVVGCIGQKMADLKQAKKNLITSIDSLKTSQELGLNFTQIGNFSNGAFLYNKKEKELSQLAVQVLNFETGQIIEEAAKDLSSANAEDFYPIMRLDDSFKKPVFGEKTIPMVKYQYDLQAFFKDDSIKTLPVVNINNEWATGFFIHEGSELYEVLFHRLKDNPNFKFVSIEVNSSQFSYDCIFILNKQEDEFYKIIEQIKQEVLFVVLKSEILKDIRNQIKSLSSESIFFRASNRAQKMMAFKKLYECIEEVEFNPTNKSFKDIFNGIIKEWEKPFENKKALATHGFKLMKKNDSLLTESEKIVRKIKNTINSTHVTTLYNFREDIIHRLIHEISRLDKKKKSARAVKKRICLEELLGDVEQINPDKTAGFFYKKLIDWEKSMPENKDINYKLLQGKSGVMKFCPFFASSSYSMLQKLKLDLNREAVRNGEVLTH